MGTSAIAIDSLPLASANELCRALTAVGARAEREPTTTRKYGDAALVNVITAITPGVLAIIAAFVVKGSSGKKSESLYRFRRLDTDGSFTEYEIKISAQERESKELSAASLKQLAALTGLTADQVSAAVAGKGK